MIRAKVHAFRVFFAPYYEFTLSTLLLTKHKHPVLFYIFIRYITYVSIRFSSIVLSTVVYISFFFSLISLCYVISLFCLLKKCISRLLSGLESALNFWLWLSTLSSASGRKSLRRSLEANARWSRIFYFEYFVTLERKPESNRRTDLCISPSP